MKIIAFPYSGSSVRSYVPLLKNIGCGVLYYEAPGHGNRVNEPLLHSFDEYLREAQNYVYENLNMEKNVILFGHSLGGVTAFEIAKYINTVFPATKVILIISGRNGPDYRHDMKFKTEKDVIDFIEKCGNFPDGLLENPSFRRAYVNLLWADLDVISTYDFKGRPVVADGVLLSGESDPIADPIKMTNWHTYIIGACELKVYKGNHTFLFDNLREIRTLIKNYVVYNK